MLIHRSAALLLLLLLHVHRFVETGLKQVGKDFNAVARIVGSSKTVADTVEFYYNWKHKDPAYKKWAKERKLVSTMMYSMRKTVQNACIHVQQC